MQNERTSGILDDFRNDFLEAWQQLPDKLIFLILFVCWCALFHFVGNATLGYVHSPSLFNWILDAYHPAGKYTESEDAHGLLVPFVVVGLLWWKREQILRLELKPWWPGLVLLALALMTHMLGYMIQQPRVSMVAFFGGLYVLTGVVWGAACMRNLFFPFFLFAFCVPLGAFSQAITTPLRHLVAMIVTAIAHLGLAPDLVRQGTQLFDAHNAFSYDIAPACSGIRSLVSLLAFTTIFGFVSFTGWRRYLIVASAFPLAIIGNVARITFTVVVAQMMGQEAGSFVEQKFGFITFAIAIAAVLLLENRLRKPKAAEVLPLQPKPT